ncbi:prephenate dehydratase [bacterium]|nr:prephenate dehydratase [bacterium]|tara:strand:+ start:5788 stop:6636 length:849 start_codon:yes stop_codon:yes gene_type:complete
MTVRVAYQGVEGSYSSIAAAEYFPRGEYVGYPTFGSVIRAVQDDKATHALLPIENSTAGRVADLHHLLPNSGLVIIGEHFLPIQHALIGLAEATLGDIEQVYSHREALAQCSRTLRKLNIVPVPFGDTAKAVSHVSEIKDKSVAALASKYTVKLYENVRVLKGDMQDRADNVTRFLVLTKSSEEQCEASDDCIISIVFDVLDTPAALYNSLGAFAKHSINIIKLESFVPMQRHRDAHFYLECIGNPEKSPLQRALSELVSTTKRMNVLGVYNKSEYRDNFER